MGTFLFIIAVWWCIHFMHYILGRRMVTNIPEQKIIEIMSSPVLFGRHFRKAKTAERWSIFISLVLFYPLIRVYCEVFEAIQKLILPTTGVNFTGNYLFVPAILVALGTLFLFIVKMASIGTTKNEDWKYQPSLKQTQYRISNVKKWSVRFSWLSQIVFIFFMFFYVNIDNQGVTSSRLLDLGVKEYSFSVFERASLSIKTQTVHRRGVKTKEFLRHYFLYLKNGKRLELWDNIGWNAIDLENLKLATQILHENNVFIDVDFPSFIDWSEYKKELAPENYRKLRDLFESCRSIANDIPDLIPANHPIKIDDLVFRLDSATQGSSQQERNFFFKPSDGKIYQYVHLTVENNRVDSFYVNGFNLRVFDERDSSYINSLWLDETFVNHVPPDTSHSGYFIFQVPIDAKDLRLQYKYGYINGREFWFDLNNSNK